MAAMLVEMFPTQIRYTSTSLPIHVVAYDPVTGVACAKACPPGVGVSSASSRLHTETETHYWPSRARRRHSPGVIPIVSVNTRRNADTDR